MWGLLVLVEHVRTVAIGQKQAIDVSCTASHTVSIYGRGHMRQWSTCTMYLGYETAMDVPDIAHHTYV